MRIPWHAGDLPATPPCRLAGGHPIVYDLWTRDISPSLFCTVMLTRVHGQARRPKNRNEGLGHHGDTSSTA